MSDRIAVVKCLSSKTPGKDKFLETNLIIKEFIYLKYFFYLWKYKSRIKNESQV
jgi:hypothetical protein